MREGLLEGKTRREVRAVLGPPDSGSKIEWSWYIGPVNGFMGPADDGWVSLVFDERTGRATDLTAP